MIPQTNLFDLLAALAVLFFILCFVTALLFWRMNLRHSESFLKTSALLKIERDCDLQGRSFELDLQQKRIQRAYCEARAEALAAQDSQYFSVLRSEFEKRLSDTQNSNQNHG
ncbi:MAG: hypothetical protein KF681_07790 [Bdellovibrionaceae bacterium]|nr:hypothetical protein [Pseudobdellovibrionaceae bacterium]